MRFNFSWRRPSALSLAACALMLLQSCGRTETASPAIFSDQDPDTEFAVEFSRLAGNINAQEFEKRLTSPNLVIEARYMPTKTLWLINADYVTHWAGQVIPLPYWVLEPRLETARLKAIDYQITNQNYLHFKVKRKLSTYYALQGIRLELPVLAPKSKWPDEPLSMNIQLALKADSPDAPAPGQEAQKARFVFESIRYAVAGSVRASNAQVLSYTDRYITTDTTSSSVQAAMVGSRYSGYQKALSDSHLRDESQTSLIFDAYRIQEHLRNPPVCEGSDTAKCCCQPTSEQANATMAEYLAIRARYRQARDWMPTELRHTKFPAASPADKVVQDLHIHAKADGRLLDLFTLEIQHGEPGSMAQCDVYSAYELFFVERRLVDYQLKARSCSSRDEARVILTRAKWNDQGQAVYFHQACPSCKGTPEQTSADEATWAAMAKFGAYIAEQVLQSPDVLTRH